MQNKVKELNNVINQNPPDMKKLQLVLQGSVSVQVWNARSNVRNMKCRRNYAHSSRNKRHRICDQKTVADYYFIIIIIIFFFYLCEESSIFVLAQKFSF